MKKLNIIAIVALIASSNSAIIAQAQKKAEIIISVTNTAPIEIKDAPIAIKAKAILEKKSTFNLDNCIVLEGDKEIPSQLNDADNNGISDKLVFLGNFNPAETKNFTIKETDKPNKDRGYKKRTQAELSHKFGGRFVKKADTTGRHEYIGGEFKNVNYLRVPAEHTDHSWFIRYEGPGWESDKVGYRFYLDWRNAIDIFGKLQDTMVLQKVGLDGFDSYHNPAPWGMDIFKVGTTLGIGSVALWDKEKVNMVSKTDSVISRIGINGPLESMIETIYFGWNVNGIKRNLTSKLIIYGGSRATCHKLYLDKNDTAYLCTGLIKDEKAELFSKKTGQGWSYIATWGKQSLNNDSLGIAILYKNSNFVKFADDGQSHIVVLKPTNGKLDYYFLAAWEKEPGGLSTEDAFKKHLNEQLQILDNPLKIEIK